MSTPAIRRAQHIAILQARAEQELRRRARARARGDNLGIQLPPWASEFQRPARYKVAWGGRGSAKSHTFARMLLMHAAERPMRILCARELQISIKDSVHRKIFGDGPAVMRAIRK
ncbi:hypothetical protein GWK36_02770 [Caldichromatium japonicum]|uniref:Phage terminase large subunit N-terminal domain-containing protein n=1 Tax=Caldichromatium japonicum TaxID=2699430 RepID=A0A6G7VAQ9_9GAMM|nr:phage terminase large subunit [Caldichromatium japonicum]QIK37101.1 hypothetical protein GWK36_02770 [Caldichromatium japonicum]